MDEAYIDKEDQGDLIAMTPTIVDMLGVFFLKVPSSSLLTEQCSASEVKVRFEKIFMSFGETFSHFFSAGFFL